MRRRQRTLAELITRSLAASGLLYAVVIAYAVPATLVADADGRPAHDAGTSSLSRSVDHPSWRRAYAQRFPGCIDMAQWGASIVPATVVVARRGGGLEQMDFDEAFRRATSPSAADDVWTIGACR